MAEMKLDRENKLLIGLCAMAGILLAKLISVQIVDYDYYKNRAEENTKVYTTIYPTRGIIHDRNGKILVGNKITYDIMVTPTQVKEFDTLALAQVLQVTPEFIKEKMDEFYANRRKIGFQSAVMMKKLPPETVIYCGHGESSDISYELKYNFYLI
jgi:penicillin-binding protein 2